MIPVIWYENPRSDDHRARYAHCTLMNETFDAVGGFEHFGTCSGMYRHDGGIMVVHGGNLRGREAAIRADLAIWKWSIVIVLGDEEGVFKTHLLQADNRKLWQQMPVPGQHNCCDRFLIEGYPDDLHRIKTAWPADGWSRDLDWFFAGQLTHSRRTQCHRFMQHCPRGTFIGTPHFFASTLSREDYYRTMSRAKVILCPGGPTSPDTFRLSEALELGCVPIADDQPGCRIYPSGYWRYLFKGEQPPFPVISEWSMGPIALGQSLQNWGTKSRRCFSWWQAYKRSWRDWLSQDIEELRVKTNCNTY